MRRLVLFFVAFALLGFVVSAQGSKPATLTEIEALKVENLNLQRVILERQIADWQGKQAHVKAEIEQARPGWTWNPETGDFQPKDTAR